MIKLTENIQFDNIPYSVIFIDFNGLIKACNKHTKDLTGYSTEELIGKKIELLICDEMFNFQSQNYQTIPCKKNIQLINKTNKPIKCTIKINISEQGYIAYIDKDEKIDLSLCSSKDSKQIFSETNDAFWEWNIEENIIHFSAQAMVLFGYQAEALTDSNSFWKAHLTNQDINAIQYQARQHLSGIISCINFTCSIITKTKKEERLTIFGKVFEFKNGKPFKIFGSIKKAFEPQNLIAELKKQNSYLQLAEKLGGAGHWHVNFTNNQLYWSKGIYDIHRVTPETYQPTLETAIDFYIKSERKKIENHLEKAVKNNEGFYFKSVIIDSYGKKVKVETLGEVETDSSGDVIGLFGVFRDITKSEELFEKFKLLAMVNYTIKVPIFFIDDNDNVVYQDLSPQIDNKKSILFNYINFNTKDYLNFKNIAKERGQLKRTNISFDKYITVFDLSVTFEPDEKIYIWIVENTTEKYRNGQKQLINNRLTLLGNTFGNVSHDINNVLGVALGATEILEIKYSQGERNIFPYIERVKNAIDKGKSVTERLLAFTRKPTIQVVEFNPIQEIKNNQYLFKQLLLNTIDFSLKLENSLYLIKFPQGEFINILLNLILNAQDAIREKSLSGHIELAANINSQEQIEIKVKDSGIGIKSENLSKIFDPFYSSKSVNTGNGIGLASVYSTIYKHKGEIRVSGDSDLGGAEFTLVFEGRKLKNDINKPEDNNDGIGIKGKSVLILDDEKSIAEFVSLFLESEGAITKHINNKQELDCQLNSKQHYDVFITDMILPDISGREATMEVLAKFPNIKVYSISGYISGDDSDWGYPVLTKPFNSKELAEFIKNN